MNDKSPCKGCTERCAEPNCHTNCEKYRKFIEAKDASRQAKRKTDVEKYASERYRDVKTKWLKKKGWRGRK